MDIPKLFIHLNDAFKTPILNAPISNKFEILEPDSGQAWLDVLQHSRAQVAIIQCDHFKRQDYESLLNNQLLGKIDFIFLSEGKPNEFIDNIMEHGACYHLRTPIDIEYLNDLLSEICDELGQGTSSSEKIITSELDQFGSLVGSSRPMRKLYRIIRKAADSNAKVLIIGESGTGKELVANTIHSMSSRWEKPFVALNCGALSPELVESELFGHVKGAFTGATKNREGVFAEANGGTLLLDEITETPLELQVKLLRVLETGEYRAVGSATPSIANVRIIAATNRNPLDAVAKERLRSDLYFRLACFPIYVPPLRERNSDIEGLAKHFLAYRNAQEQTRKGISDEALSKIKNHSWPGNVRELKHVIERAYLLCQDTINSDHIIIDPGAESDNENPILQGMTLKELEQKAILKTLEENQGKKAETAKQLGISVKTLYNKLESYQDAN